MRLCAIFFATNGDCGLFKMSRKNLFPDQYPEPSFDKGDAVPLVPSNAEKYYRIRCWVPSI